MFKILIININLQIDIIMAQHDIFKQTFLKCLVENPFPILDIKDRNGYSGYIDFIGSSEFNTSAIQGVDYASRPFVCLKMKCYLANGCELSAYQTFFQRYTNNIELWMGTSNSKALMCTVGGMNSIQQALVRDLIINKSVDIPDSIYDYYKFRIFNDDEDYNDKSKRVVKVILDESVDLSQDWRLALVGHYDGPR